MFKSIVSRESVTFKKSKPRFFVYHSTLNHYTIERSLWLYWGFFDDLRKCLMGYMRCYERRPIKNIGLAYAGASSKSVKTRKFYGHEMNHSGKNFHK